MLFNSIKEMNRLLSKKMLNIYLKVTIEETNWRSQNFDYLDLKNLSPCQFSRAPTDSSYWRMKSWILLEYELYRQLCVSSESVNLSNHTKKLRMQDKNFMYTLKAIIKTKCPTGKH